MAQLKRLWVGMLTHDVSDSGTDSPIVLIINTAGGRGDKLHHTFPNTEQKDQQEGQANLYKVKEDDFAPQSFDLTVDTDDINTSSIRVGIRGADKWRPKSFVVWGEQKDDGAIIPLVLNTDLQPFVSFAGSLGAIELSTDASEGKLSFSPRPVQPGSADTQIRRLLMLMTTADEDDAGTDDKIEIRITTSAGTLVVAHEIPDTSQDDQEKAQANFYFVPVITPFTRNDLNDDSIRLSIKGDDAWLPNRFFLFGLDEEERDPDFLVPLIHLPGWPFGWLSTDHEEGEDSYTLPLVDLLVSGIEKKAI
jgi:hypothetical protein